MAVFTYRGTTLDGAVMEGVIEAADRNSAIERLKQNGVIPLSIALPSASGKSPVLNVSFGRKRQHDLQIFTTELAALLAAGIPLDRCLAILARISENAGMRNVIENVLNSIRKGNSFSGAIAEHPDVFSRIYVNLVRAGEAGGMLEAVLQKLGEFLDSMREVRESVLSAMIYPAILVLTGGLSIAILLLFVLPRFSVIFEDIGTALPLSTKALLAVSSAFRSYWWAFVILPVILWTAYRVWIRTERGTLFRDRLILRLAGDLVLKLETARFARTLGTLLQGGVPLLQSLVYAQDTIGNRVVSSTIDSVISAAREGKGVAEPLAREALFPQLALSMITVGEETGQLDAMLLEVARHYEGSLRVSIRRFMGIFEPAMILAMAVIIGFIVISMLTAIFSIIEVPF